MHSMAVSRGRKILCICFSGTELLAAFTRVPWLKTTVRRPFGGGRWFLVPLETLQSHTNDLNDGCSLISSTLYGVQMFHMLQRLLWVSPVSKLILGWERPSVYSSGSRWCWVQSRCPASPSYCLFSFIRVPDEWKLKHSSSGRPPS